MTKELTTITQLTPAQVTLCALTAAEIRTCDRAMLKEAFQIGQLLITVRDQIDHGQFGAWLKREVGFTGRTAQNYMNAARALADKYETVSHLPMKTVYDIAALPEANRLEIVDLITDPNTPPIAEIKRLVEAQKATNRPGPLARIEKIKSNVTAKTPEEITPTAKKAAEREVEKQREDIEVFQRVDDENAEVLREQAARWIKQLGPSMAAELLQAIHTNEGIAVMNAIKEAADASAAPPLNDAVSLNVTKYNGISDSGEIVDFDLSQVA